VALHRAPALAIQFAGGLDTKTDSKQVQAVKLLNLENATFIKQTTLAKRNGYRSLGRQVDETGLQMPDAIGMATRSDELVVFDGDRAWSYRDSVDQWRDGGEVTSVVQTDVVVAGSTTKQTSPDHATNGGVTAVAWEDSRGGVWCQVIEQASGRVLVSEVQVDADGQRPRCVAVGTVVLVLWAKPTTSEIWLAIVNPAAITTPVKQLLTGDLWSSNPVYDACPSAYDADLLPGVIAWATASGYRVGYLHSSGVLGSPVTGLPSVASYTDEVDGAIGVCFNETTGASVSVVWTGPIFDSVYRLHVRITDSADLTDVFGVAHLMASAPYATRIACAYDDADNTEFCAEFDGGRSDLNYVAAGTVDLAAATVRDPATRILKGHCVASRAYHDNGNVWASVCHAVQYFPYVAVVKLSSDTWGGTDGNTLASHSLPGTSTGALPRSHVPSVQPVDPDENMLSRSHAVCYGYRIQLPVDSDQASSTQFTEDGIRVVTLEHDSDASFQSAQLGQGLYLASACMQHYDGRRWTEAQFLCAPDVAEGAVIATATTTGSVANGTYNVVLCYEWVDALGELHRGPCSVPVTVTVGGGNNAIQLVMPTYRLTFRDNVRICAFRSEANATGEPESIPYFQITGIDPSVVTGNNCYVPNDPTDDSVVFVDGLADADLLTRSALYTNGGILSNDPAPCAGNAIAGGKSRLFWTDPSDPNLVRYSQERADDNAMEASVALTLRCDPYGGRVVALGVMDNAVYPFKATAVMVFGGPGPDADGGATTQNAFSPVDLVTSDVGCSAPTSICQLPDGIAFQSSKGIKILDRQRDVLDIGAPVYAYNDQTIKRATLLPDRHQVVFLTDDGVTLLFDYSRGQWSKYTNHLGYDGVVRLGRYHYLRTDGRIFRETPGEYRDDYTHITMKIETAWLSAAQYRQGWQRIWHALFLGSYKSEHTLRMRYRIDYREAYAEPLTADVNANYDPSRYGSGDYGDGYYGGTLGDTQLYQREFHLNKRCQAIAFELSDIEEAGSFGASFELSELLLTGGILGPRQMVGAARRG
jgi:hypothetical protein